MSVTSWSSPLAFSQPSLQVISVPRMLRLCSSFFLFHPNYETINYTALKSVQIAFKEMEEKLLKEVSLYRTNRIRFTASLSLLSHMYLELRKHANIRPVFKTNIFLQ